MNQGYIPNINSRQPAQSYYRKPKNNKKKVTIIVGVILGLVVLIIAFGVYRLKKNGVELTKVKVNDIKYMVNGVIDDVKSLGKKKTSNYDESDSQVSTASEGQQVTLNGDSIKFSGAGATVNGSIFNITSAGTYTFSGTLDNGQIIVEAGDHDKVDLVFAGVEISCSNSAAIIIKNADKTTISLENGTKNIVSDGKKYTDTSKEAPTATIYSKDDLIINGEGSLKVNGNYDNGIKSTNDLKITGGNISVTAVQNGVVGKDSFYINNGILNVTASADGIKSNNEEESDKGQIIIEGGTISVKSGGKSIKSTNDLNISGGELNLSSSDDAIHSNSNITINGGKIILSAEDDGIHANSELTISKGDIRIDKSYEGLESAVINIKGGTVKLASSDDGVNASSKDSSSSGRNQFSSQSGVEVNISGGYLYVDAQGDGLDSNGVLTISGGTTIINGPTANNNGALDSNGGITVTGGTLVAAGSVGMAETPGKSSSQYSISLGFSSVQSARSIVNIADASENSILTFAPAKKYQSLIFSSPDIKNGASYSISTGGDYSTKSVDGLFRKGIYKGGSILTKLTISSVVTEYGGRGSSGGSGGGFRPGSFW